MINENYGETEKAFSKLPSLKMYDSCLHSCEVLFLCCDQETLDALAEMYSLLNEEDIDIKKVLVNDEKIDSDKENNEEDQSNLEKSIIEKIND